MRMSYTLNLQQTQKLIMTPELRQAITILQLGMLDLTQYIREEVTQNPVLELKEDAPEEDAAQTDGRDEPDWIEYFSDCSDLGYVRPVRDDDRLPFDRFKQKDPTLHEHLTWQLCLAPLSDREREIGEFLIGNIDDNGYLCCTLEDVSAYFGIGKREVEEVLEVIQTFDPVGVGARNLRECLTIQIDYLGCTDRLVRGIVDSYLEDLAAGRLSRIAEGLGCSVRDVQRAADLIRTLDPKPGRRYAGSGDTNYIIPDIIVERVCGEYVIIVNDALLPRLSINHYYRKLLKEGKDSETKRFLENRLNSALWLLRSIEQRRLTLYRVMESIVKIQKDYFDYGPRCLKPMTLRQVAEMVGVHESTVSRAVANKYVQTPHGVTAVRDFFNSGLSNSAGESVSSTAIKRMLRELIASEDPSNPLSDQKIAALFAKRGISISRRTVTKYREEIGICSSNKRRRYQ